MRKVAIKVEGISKSYVLGQQQRYKALRDSLTSALYAPFRLAGSIARGEGFGGKTGEDELFWALQDVSFEVPQGEVIGVIGRNGAGKSTLLKILSRITEPTSGRAVIRGRIGSLLEVGTGFHPELTGRENIFLNGAILGMRRREIARKFDEIVAFAETERFLDTPVKHYSSGMYVRLAFAVAAHLEPDILLVDEVLAVGDVEFQKKCLGKMQSVGREGRTVLFVSHNMPAVTGLCTRAVLMERGRVTADGPAGEVVMRYIENGATDQAEITWAEGEAPKNEVVEMIRVRSRDVDGNTSEQFDIRKPIGIDIEYRVTKPGVWFTPSIQVENELGLLLFNSAAQIDPTWDDCIQTPGVYRSTCWIPGNLLAEGAISVRMTMWGFSRPPHKGIVLNDAVRFFIFDPLEGDSVRGKTTGSYPGIVRPMLDWTTEPVRDRGSSVPAGPRLVSTLEG